MIGHVIAMDTGIIARIIGRIIEIGVRRSIVIRRAIAQPRCIVVATRMCAGATIAIAPTAHMTIRSSPIMGQGVSAIRPIFKQKSPGKSGAFL